VCAVNIQHDCLTGKCDQTDFVRICQERIETIKISTKIVHSLTNQYVLNVYSIHNYQYIHSTMPSALQIRHGLIENASEILRKATFQM
jgi:hypothetical protein